MEQMAVQEAQDHRETPERPDAMDLQETQRMALETGDMLDLLETGDIPEMLEPQVAMPSPIHPKCDTCLQPRDPLEIGHTTDTQERRDTPAMLAALEAVEHLGHTDLLVTGDTLESQDSAEGRESQVMAKEQLEHQELVAHQDTLGGKQPRESREHQEVQELVVHQEIPLTT